MGSRSGNTTVPHKTTTSPIGKWCFDQWFSRAFKRASEQVRGSCIRVILTAESNNLDPGLTQRVLTSMIRKETNDE